MSEFTNHKERRISKLLILFDGILKGEQLSKLVEYNRKLINSVVPSDIVYLVDRLVLMEIPMTELKKGLNKLINLLFKTISEYPYVPPKRESFLGCLVENDRFLDEKLKSIKPLLKELNQDEGKAEIKTLLNEKLVELEKFNQYYSIKENILFPVIEKYVPDFRCLSVMWSFHDDIKRNLRNSIEELESSDFGLKQFNRYIGDLFFNMYAIKFREERILYPLVEEIIPENILNRLFEEAVEIGFPFYQLNLNEDFEPEVENVSEKISLETGYLSLEQIILLFNHLPVDITFVDENNKVAYFSTPKKRIFPRTKSIIGRDVHNCHPPESVHVVHRIVEEFRNGTKDSASFWIEMKGQKLLIQYFAVRNKHGNYKGVVEVSQEITEIQQLKGEKRLLDWEE